MAFVGTLCLSATLAFGLIMELGNHGSAALCGGRRYETSRVPHGASPYVTLRADGVTGPFLLDYGATRSSLSAGVFPGSTGSIRKASISLPGVEQGNFDLSRYDLLLQPEQGQVGVIATDLLSLISVQLTGSAAFLGDKPCNPDALRARGLVPVAQKGFFSSDLSEIDDGLPNVPVVFLRLGDVRAWAQIDTGYDDTVYTHSVDINEALFEDLVKGGAKLERLADINVWTCDGHESRTVYTTKGRTLVIENERAKRVAQTDKFHLILKPENSCGGIAAMTVPAAQLGASFLKLFGTVVFDPRSQTVWLEGDEGKQRE